jgi:hypothetical protein
LNYLSILSEFLSKIEIIKVIRHLELHQHYEKLLPPPSQNRTHETFVPVPFFRDFLVVHPYNRKSSYYFHTNELAAPSSIMLENFVEPQQPNINTSNNNNNETRYKPFLVEAETLKIDYLSNHNNFHGIKRKPKRNERYYRNDENAKIGDFDLNHIFLINKRKHLRFSLLDVG